VGPAEMADDMPLGGLRGGSFSKGSGVAGEGKRLEGGRRRAVEPRGRRR
jgi:hypothetical protein